MVLLDVNSGSIWVHILDSLKNWDTWLLLKINNEWTSPFLSNTFPWWREATTWLPLYLFLLVFIFLNFGRRAWFWVLFLILVATITDQVSSGILKDWINRPRPCSDDVLMYQVNLLLNRCPSSGSFTSSHAANHFAVATFLFGTLNSYIKKWGYLFFFWAATISYGQVYVGVHYPLDVICGAMLGSGIGYMMASIFNRRVGLVPLIKKEKM